MNYPPPRFLFGTWVGEDVGSRLLTDVYFPESNAAPSAPRPTILMRTPYGTRTPALMNLGRLMAQLGFVTVLQNVAGRYGSEGCFEPFVNELRDSALTLKWLQQQPWFKADQGLCLFGVSYSAYTAFATLEAAASQSLPVVGLVTIAGLADPHAHFYHHGCFQLHWALPWSYMVAGARGTLPSLPGLHAEATSASASPKSTTGSVLFDHWRSRPKSHDGYWRTCNMLPHISAHPVPSLHLAGTYDFSLDVGLAVFRAMEAACPRRGQLVIGPWDHNQIFAAFLQHLENRAKRNDGAQFLADLFIGLLNQPKTSHTQSHDRFYVWQRALNPKDEGWLTLPEPLTDEDNQELPLQPPSATLVQHPFVWEHDPNRPLPWARGNCWTLTGWSEAGPVSLEPETDSREAFFQSAPLQEPLRIRGAVSMALQPCSETPAEEPFNVAVRLWCCTPDGRRHWVRDGVIQLPAGASGTDAPWISVPLGWTCFTFPKGSRVAVSVSGSLYPKFAVVGATRRFFHGGGHANPPRLSFSPHRAAGTPAATTAVLQGVSIP